MAVSRLPGARMVAADVGADHPATKRIVSKPAVGRIEGLAARKSQGFSRRRGVANLLKKTTSRGHGAVR